MRKFTIYNLQFTIRFALLLFALYIVHFTFYINPVYAQNTGLDTAYSYAIIDPEAQDGDILIYSDKGLVRTSSPFETAMFGVLQSNPVILIELADNTGQPVVKSGIADVNVTNTNGPIKKGDYITSSSVPGKGQRADKSGYMLGVAMAESTGSGKIPVSLDIKYVDLYSLLPPAANKLLKSLDNILLASTQDPEKFTKLVRYIAAAIIVLGAFLISFLTFSKSMTNSVEAIGRNPLARNSIYFSLVINVVVAVIALLVGLASAFILIKL